MFAVKRKTPSDAPEHHQQKDTQMTTYKIVRFYQDLDRRSRVMARGLTLEEAQAHCQREDTHGDGWFDGYDEDTI
jgi:hypothetical protein